MALRDDADSKAMWWTEYGGWVYASSAAGQVTGFRAGHMEPGWQGSLIIDDPVKPDDAYSEIIRDGVNTRFNETIRSRLAIETTPILVIMQRIHFHDLSGYLLRGGSGENWHRLNLPVLIDNSETYSAQYPENTHAILIEHSLPDGWLWPYKHNESHRVSLFSHQCTAEAQYMQSPRRFNAEGALWSEAMVPGVRALDIALQTSRTVVAIDPQATNSEESDETGIVVASSYGRGNDRLFSADADYSGKYSPNGWAKRAIRAYEEHHAEAIVIETNQGGDNCHVLEDYCREIRARVKQETHLTVGVCIAPTKTLAKLANLAAKKWTKTAGVLDLSNTERQKKLMARVQVEDVWGVGRHISKKLNAMGIVTARDLSEQSTYIIRKHFNVVLERTVRELRGEPCLGLEEFAPTKQQIVCSRSFGSRITEYQDMRQAVCAYAERAAEKLRSERQYCRQIAVFVRTSPHATGETFYGNQAMGTLMSPSNDTRDIMRVAMESLDRIWLDGCRFMKAGVMLGDFYSQGVSQLNLFDEFKPKANSEALMRVVDGLNQSGKGKLWFAGQGVKKTWVMKREMLSQAYTTRFSDIPPVAR